MVAGYQGGELNPAGNYLLVHQFDAHAWVEYWQPEQGWLSVDPTYQVAPERIEQGLEQALAGTASTSPTHRCRRCATVACPGSTTCVWPGTA